MYIEHANVLHYGPGKDEYFSKVNLIPIYNSGATLSKLLLDHSALQFKKIVACMIHIGPFSLLLLSRKYEISFFLYLKIDIFKISFLLLFDEIVPYNLLAPDDLGSTVEPLWRGELGIVLFKHLNQL